MIDIIARKRDALPLSPQDIARFVHGVTDGSVPDYQAAALLMAIRIRGMSDEEAACLAREMAASGEQADLSAFPCTADKHSTGGVGDTTTLICVPLAAACGVTVVKMSGRALGHTGGTLDKLMAIPGYDPFLPMPDFLRVARDVGAALGGQTGQLCPADKTLYALRDVTATADSLPLIAASIMSKKLAAGAGSIVLDVKFGSGALMKDRAEALALARLMVDIGRAEGRRCTALVTDMDEPLGSCVGNALEVREAIEVLSGRAGETPLCALSVQLAALMVALALDIPEPQALARVREALACGAGLRKLRQMVGAHLGDPRVVDEPGLLPRASRILPLRSEKAGYVSRVQADLIGQAAHALGAGRERAGDAVDLSVGLVLKKRVGARVEAGDTLCALYAPAAREPARRAAELAAGAFALADEPPPPRPLIAGRV